MTDTYRLKCKILKSGLKMKDIAKSMGITYCSLQKKINNSVEFKASEIMDLSDILKIKDMDERESIFFIKKRDLQSTKKQSDI